MALIRNQVRVPTQANGLMTPNNGESAPAPAPVPLYATVFPDGTKVISHSPLAVPATQAATITAPTTDNSQLIKYALIGLAVYLLLKK